MFPLLPPARVFALPWAWVPALFFMAGLACSPGLEPENGCQEDDECGSGEACLQGTCTQALFPDGGDADGGFPDSGPGDSGPIGPDDSGVPDAGKEDAGPPPNDAGNSTCERDDLNNGSLETAWQPAAGTLADGRVIVGRFCPDEDEFFQFSAVADPPPADVVHAVAAWTASSDLDLTHFDPLGNEAPVGFSVHRFMEATTLQVTQNGTQKLRLVAYDTGDIPDEGMVYGLQVRSGLACRTEADCPGPNHCLMPLWTPLYGGRPPDANIRFLPGLCGPEYVINCALADSTDHGGLTQSRDDATGISPSTPVAEAWSCQYDEDWFVHTMSQGGNLSVEFQNRSATAGTYLVTIFDDAGNLLRGMGYDLLQSDDPQTILIPYLGDGAQAFIRVFQFNVDDLGNYALAVNEIAANCTNNADCSGNPNAADFGRVECNLGACQCPATGCGP
jgi:hypothetical protein